MANFCFSLVLAALAIANVKAALVDTVHLGFTPVANTKANSLNEVINKLEVQIRTELQASYLYQAYAYHFERPDVALPGFHKFFSDASKEERDHAEKLIAYVNKKGGHIKFTGIDFTELCSPIKTELETIRREISAHTPHKNHSCICYYLADNTKMQDTWAADHITACKRNRHHWKNGLFAMLDTLSAERIVTRKLLQLHHDVEIDPVLIHMLEHDFLNEQIDAVKKIGDYVAQLERFEGGQYHLGEYMFDKKLQ